MLSRWRRKTRRARLYNLRRTEERFGRRTRVRVSSTTARHPSNVFRDRSVKTRFKMRNTDSRPFFRARKSRIPGCVPGAWRRTSENPRSRVMKNRFSCRTRRQRVASSMPDRPSSNNRSASYPCRLRSATWGRPRFSSSLILTSQPLVKATSLLHRPTLPHRR